MAEPWGDLLKNPEALKSSDAVAQLAELIDSVNKPLPGRPTASLVACLGIARTRLREALTAAGITEYRAMVTADPAAAKAHAEALSAVDAAYATMWAYEAAGAKVRVHDIEARRIVLLEKIQDLSAKKKATLSGEDAGKGRGDLANLLDELLSTHRALTRLSSPTEAEIRFPVPESPEGEDVEEDAPPPKPTQSPAKKAKAVRDRLRQSGRLLMASEEPAAVGGGRRLRSAVGSAAAGRMLQLRSRVAV